MARGLILHLGYHWHCTTPSDPARCLGNMRYQGASQASKWLPKFGLCHPFQEFKDDLESEVKKNLFWRTWECFTNRLFSLFVIDSEITHKAIQTIKSIDTFGVFAGSTSANVCMSM